MAFSGRPIELGRLTNTLFAAVLAGSFGIPIALAQSESWDTVYDALLERPDVTVSVQTREDGSEVRTFNLPGGVDIVEERQDGETSAFRVDNSGHGAVLCTWGFYIALETFVEVCPKLHKEASRDRYSDALSRINFFIRDNMLEPTTIEQVEKAASERRDAAYDLYRSAGDNEKFCHDSEYAKFVEAYGNISDKEFNAYVDKLLSVPRLPVIGPCF